MTNADRIRNMTDEELAKILHEYDMVKFCQNREECSDFNTIKEEDCCKCALEWLQKEV